MGNRVLKQFVTFQKSINMKTLIFAFAFISSASFAQNVSEQKKDTKTPQIVEAACGQCQWDLQGKGCDLAVRIDGKSYFVDGTAIDKHGDAHSKDGLCNAIRKAEVTGKVVNGRFKAKSFKLLSAAEEKK